LLARNLVEVLVSLEDVAGAPGRRGQRRAAVDERPAKAPGIGIGPVLLTPGTLGLCFRAIPFRVRVVFGEPGAGAFTHGLAVAPGDRRTAEHGQEQQRGQQQGNEWAAAGRLDRALEEADRPGLDRFAVEEPAQVFGQRKGGGVAARAVLLETLQADRLQVPRGARLELSWRHRLLFEDLAERIERGGGLEGRSSGEALVQDRSQRVHIDPRVDGVSVTAGLFGRHVRGRPHHSAGLRYPLAPGLLGEAEVGDLGSPRLSGERRVL
jgi:hypothetical protein